MIGYLQGRVLIKEDQCLVLLAGTVGYEVGVPPFLLHQIQVGEEVKLFIHTHVREDELTLYGFETLQDKQVFRRMISISGVGPKLALTIQSTLPLQELIEVVKNRDVARFKKVPGIGAKKAEKLLLELQSKLKIENMVPASRSKYGGAQSVLADLEGALEHLGYKSNEYSPEISRLVNHYGEKIGEMSLGQILPKILQALSGGISHMVSNSGGMS